MFMSLFVCVDIYLLDQRTKHGVKEEKGSERKKKQSEEKGD